MSQNNNNNNKITAPITITFQRKRPQHQDNGPTSCTVPLVFIAGSEEKIVIVSTDYMEFSLNVSPPRTRFSFRKTSVNLTEFSQAIYPSITTYYPLGVSIFMPIFGERILHYFFLWFEILINFYFMILKLFRSKLRLGLDTLPHTLRIASTLRSTDTDYVHVGVSVSYLHTYNYIS